MEKEIVEIPKLSDALRKIGVPLSPCVRAGGFLYVSGLPPLDLDSGTMVKGGDRRADRAGDGGHEAHAGKRGLLP